MFVITNYLIMEPCRTEAIQSGSVNVGQGFNAKPINY